VFISLVNQWRQILNDILRWYGNKEQNELLSDILILMLYFFHEIGQSHVSMISVGPNEVCS
jgi:hypothetical protein